MLRRNAKTVLAVGGLDPSGLAGILADARVLQRLGVAHAVATSAVTAQNRDRFFSWEPVSLKLFREQLEAAPRRLAGLKIGMLGDAAHAKVLADFIAQRRPAIVLWDPVIAASSGARLLKQAGLVPALHRLLSQSDLLTPNVPEAEWLLGRRLDAAGLRAALAQLLSGLRRGGAVLLKGGHRFASDDARQAIDYFAERDRVTPLAGPRRRTERRGTGCTFGAAWLAHLVLGKNRIAAARAAKRYVLDHVFNAPAP